MSLYVYVVGLVLSVILLGYLESEGEPSELAPFLVMGGIFAVMWPLTLAVFIFWFLFSFLFSLGRRIGNSLKKG